MEPIGFPELHSQEPCLLAVQVYIQWVSVCTAEDIASLHAVHASGGIPVAAPISGCAALAGELVQSMVCSQEVPAFGVCFIPVNRTP